MATGTPKGRRKSELSSGKESPSTLSLNYEGKTSESEVLAGERGCIVPIWQSPSFAGEGCLYFGDNLPILLQMLDDPAICGKVQLIYIDPPFATQTAFHSRSLRHAYEDVLVGADYIESLRQRLIVLKNLLAEDGSIYLHLDDKMVFHMKIILDEVFGQKNFRNCIVRKKCNPKNYTRKQYGNIADYILFYTKSDQYVWNKPVEVWTESRAKEYQYVEEGTGRKFMKVPVHAPGVRNGETGKPWRGMMPPPGKHWQYPPSKLDELDSRGEIFWSSNGNPRRKVYLDQSPGVGVQDIWMDFRDAHNQNICITGYPTEKNPDLLRRIVQASSNPEGIVLDAYCGSGTTLAIASELQRRWIGIDRSDEALRTILRRFETGLEPMGDFVNGKSRKTRSKEDQSAFAFDEATRMQKGHAAVRDYALFATREFAEEAKRVLGGKVKK